VKRIANRSRLAKRTLDKGFSRYLVLPFDKYEMSDGLVVVWNVKIAKRQSAAAWDHLSPVMRPTVSGGAK
jgi:hypothetical protein